MNREIIFRGKSTNNDKWVYAELHGFGMDLFNECVRENTIGQFTGLFDKNGKEIYEGDILGTNGKIIGWVKGGARGYCYDVVYINHPTGEKRWSLYGTVVEDFNNKIEVISNIHDNPELIKEE